MHMYSIVMTSEGIGVERIDGKPLSDEERTTLMRQMLSQLEKPSVGSFVDQVIELIKAIEAEPTKSSEPRKAWKSSIAPNARLLREVESNIRDQTEELKRVRKNAFEISAFIDELKEKREDLKKAMNREIPDSESPRCGQLWETFEKDISEDKFADFIYDMAKKFGRSTLAIRYRLLRLLVAKLPKDDLLAKVGSMMR